MVKKPLTPLERLCGPLPELLTADIVLVHIKRSPLRALLRSVTNSYWDHVAMVVYPSGEHNVDFTIIIENIQHLYYGLKSPGTEIHKLDKYLYNPKKYRIGIKRVPGLDREHRERIRLFMMMNIDTPYWKLSFIKFLAARLIPWYRNRLLRRQRWSCSALVQKAYFESTVTWEARQQVIFKEGDWSPIEMQELTSPADIARSSRAVWIYNQQ